MWKRLRTDSTDNIYEFLQIYVENNAMNRVRTDLEKSLKMTLVLENSLNSIKVQFVLELSLNFEKISWIITKGP